MSWTLHLLPVTRLPHVEADFCYVIYHLINCSFKDTHPALVQLGQQRVDRVQCGVRPPRDLMPGPVQVKTHQRRPANGVHAIHKGFQNSGWNNQFLC
jgi:hypothetical protein